MKYITLIMLFWTTQISAQNTIYENIGTLDFGMGVIENFIFLQGDSHVTIDFSLSENASVYTDIVPGSFTEIYIKNKTTGQKASGTLLKFTEELDWYEYLYNLKAGDYTFYGYFFIDKNTTICVNFLPKPLILNLQNYIKARTYTQDDGTAYMDHVQYVDGLGRPIQSVEVGASPEGKDIVTLIKYDAYGREARKYLPYEANHGNGTYNLNVLSAQDSFYKAPSTSTVKDNFPYAQTVFEPSPLNRVVKQGSPGGDWHPDYGRTARIWYNSNTLNEVPLWKITDNGAAATDSYPAATLYRTDVVDENNHLRYEYRDLQGRIVRTSCEKPGGMAHTTYVFNDFGDLAFVIPDTITVVSFTKDDEIFSKFIYAYEYDDRRQVIRKHIPGSGWSTIVYNFRKLPVMAQTTEQKERNEWDFTKYDALGRIVMTGVLTDSRSFEEITADAQQFAWSGTMDGPCREAFDYFDPNFTGGAMGYSNCSFPYQVPEVNIKAVYYYNNYDFNLDAM